MSKNDYINECSDMNFYEFIEYSNREIDSLIRAIKGCYDIEEKENMYDLIHFIKNCIFCVSNNGTRPATVEDVDFAKIQVLCKSIKLNKNYLYMPLHSVSSIWAACRRCSCQTT